MDTLFNIGGIFYSVIYFMTRRVFMGKTSAEQVAVIDLTKGNKQPFARKVAVVAYHLKEHKPGMLTPHFLFTVIVPKQPEKVTNNWNKAKQFKLPSGFSLIKGTREMLMDGKEQDIPPSYGAYFRKMTSGSLKKKDVDERIDGVVPALLSALKESKEEAGVKLNNIQLIFDIGVRGIKINGRNLRVNSFALELKHPTNGKAIDSLGMEYFTLRELKLAAKQRIRYNIPLVRPSHVHFVNEVFTLIKKHYEVDGKTLSKKSTSKKKEKKLVESSKKRFIELVKDAKKGKFLAHKHKVSKTTKNIIDRSIKSREKRNQVHKKTP
ncbi:MAG: hypothetical protein KAR08_08620 [Candidatus Heimdallarchaeota archaeon]|nr:hypothetical protein [Candidatus Heimdallarchaeota archaeon]